MLSYYDWECEMSTDYVVRVFVGVPVDHVETETIRTKYDEDTGKPYKLHNIVNTFRVANKDFENLEDIADWCEEYKLELIEDYVGEEHYVGIILHSGDVKEGDGFSDYSLDDISDTINDVYDILKQQALTQLKNDVKLYVLGEIF